MQGASSKQTFQLRSQHESNKSAVPIVRVYYYILLWFEDCINRARVSFSARCVCNTSLQLVQSDGSRTLIFTLVGLVPFGAFLMH